VNAALTVVDRVGIDPEQSELWDLVALDDVPVHTLASKEEPPGSHVRGDRKAFVRGGQSSNLQAELLAFCRQVRAVLTAHPLFLDPPSGAAGSFR